MQDVEKRLLNGGLDMDSSVRVIENGKYRYGYNLRVGINDNDKFNNVERTRGNTLIPNDALPVGDNLTIGRYEDTVSNHLYFFNYNSNSQHGIYRLELDTQSITTVLIDPLLNFSNDADYIITGIDVAYIDVNQPILGWTDGGAPNTISPTVIYNPPRQLDVNKAILYSQGDFVNGYSAITVEILDQIKWPPKFSPSVQMVNDNQYNKNNLRGRIFQFKYRYVYFDFSKSAWSPISEVSVPVGDEFIGSAFVQAGYLNNRIDITVAQGATICKKIEIAVRVLNSTNTDFYLFDTVDNVLTPFATFPFYNDKNLTQLELNESNKLYDDVPRVAQAETIIAGNRKVWSNVVNQFDLVEPNVTITPTYQDVPLPQVPPNVTTLNSTVSSNIITTARFGPVVPIFGPAFYYPQGTVFDFGSFYGQFVPSTSDLASWATFLTAIGDFLATGGATSYIIGPSLIPPLGINQIEITAPVANGSINITTALSIIKYSSFKSGAVHPFGIVYYDRANRSSTVIRNNTFDVYANFITELPYQVPQWPFRQIGFDWAINHTPPIWATHYQWVYAKDSLTSSFIQFTIRSCTATSTKLEIQFDTIDDYSIQYPNSILSYSYTAGDRMRVMFVQGGTGVPNTYYDVAVTGFDVGSFKLTTDLIPPADLTLTAGTLIEIYTPKNVFVPNEALYYEFSNQYEIGDAGLPTRFHKGQTQDQTNTLPALGSFDRGDVWLRARQMSSTNDSTFLTYTVEDFNYSDFYASNAWDIGRPNGYDEDFRETRRPTTTFYSQPFIPETNINGLGSVFPENFGSDDLQVLLKYGEINYIYADGKDLIIFQKLKTGFIPINYRVAFDGAQQNIVGQTDRVLNQIVYYNGEYGIGNHAEAFAYYGFAKYFPDTLRGVSCRLSNDGITEISTIYKVHNFTSDKFGEIQSFPTKIKMWGAFDRRHQEYVYCASNTQFKSRKFNGYTVGFSEAYNMWSTFYGYEPDCIGSLGLDLVSFKNGECFMHLQTSPISNFYGIQQNSHIVVPSNKMPSESKVYMNTSLECDKALEAPEIETSQGNLSNLIIDDFEDTEGKYYAGFWFDQNTPNVANPLIEGDSLRGFYMLMKLQDNTNTNFSLFAVNFGFNLSRPNGI